jgi:integrase
VVQLSRHITEPGEALVFTSPTGKPLRYPNWLRRVWAPGLAKARLADPQPTPHDLRHTYASWLADAGRPPHEIAAIMGHASLQSVQRYLHASEARFEGARDALGERQESGRSTHPRPTPTDPSRQISRSEEG